MARVKYSVLLSDVSGSVGRATFQKYAGGSTLRNKPIPRKQNTTFQAEARNYVSQVQTSWAGLTSDQQASWSSFTGFVSTFQKNNQKVLLSGFALFLKYNLIRLHAGLAILTSFSYTPLAVLPTSIGIVVSGGAMSISFDEDFIVATSFILVKFSPVKSNPTLTFKNRLRVIPLPVTYPSGQSEWDITSAYSERFGLIPSPGDKILGSVTFFSTVAPIIYKEDIQIITIT